MNHRCDGFRHAPSTARPMLVAVDLKPVSCTSSASWVRLWASGEVDLLCPDCAQKAEEQKRRHSGDFDLLPFVESGDFAGILARIHEAIAGGAAIESKV